MRSMRWKNQYSHGNTETTRRNKRLLGCFNKLLESAEQKEHCQEMEQFLIEKAADLDKHLQQDNVSYELKESNFYNNMLQSLPLTPYGTTACRKCGLCDLAKTSIAQHLQAAVDCLQDPEYKGTLR